MADVAMVAVVLGFFAMAITYVSWCDRIVGPDEQGVSETSNERSGSNDDRSRASAEA